MEVSRNKARRLFNHSTVKRAALLRTGVSPMTGGWIGKGLQERTPAAPDVAGEKNYFF